MDELLLDSTYLLPIFGISLELQDFESVFTRLPDNYVVKYNPVSLIETKWTVIRRSRKMKDRREELLQSYRQGLVSIQQRDSSLQSTSLTNEAIEEFSDVLLTQFHIQDYFDRLIYSTAVHSQYILLTEDDGLHDLFKKNTNLARPKKVIKWKELLGAKRKSFE